MTALYEPTIKSTPSAEDFPPIFSILGKELAPKFYQGQPVITKRAAKPLPLGMGI